MGFFAFYCGIVYNEFFSIPLKLYNSCYEKHYEHNIDDLPPSSKLPSFEYVRTSPQCVPIVGFDSVWFFSAEEVSFVNSFKMKLSIIVGVIHMVLGIFMKGVNSYYFKKPLDFIFEFIPQLIFMLSTFGYMCVAIIVKWLQNWGDGSKAPSIISLFINMGVATPETGILWGDDMGVVQTYYQQKFFLVAFICVLLMLIPKPLILTLQIVFAKKENIEKPKMKEFNENEDDEDCYSDDELDEKLLEKKNNEVETDHSAKKHAGHGPGEIWVDQLIEIIEFVLGSISNTASYLRLWALSLAHGQLAKVFLTMTLLPGLKSGNIFIVMIGFPMFIICTFGVLIIMDAMECFLHTLRLHWVEFQNKFYKGDGHAFTSFNLNKKLAEIYENQ